jgi:hypothetical protein
MAYLFETLLFLLPFVAFWLWRRLRPRTEPGPAITLLALAGAALMIGGALWYGVSRSMAPGEVYVPARIEDGHIVPGHAGR